MDQGDGARRGTTVRTTAVAIRPWRRDPQPASPKRLGSTNPVLLAPHPRTRPIGRWCCAARSMPRCSATTPRGAAGRRRLAAEGSAVERFHYRGAGNSAGGPERLALDTMVEDGIAAVRHLRKRVGDVPGRLFWDQGRRVGCRRGRRGGEGAGMALWQPLVKGSSYMREAERSAMARAITRTGEERPPPLRRGPRMPKARPMFSVSGCTPRWPPAWRNARFATLIGERAPTHSGGAGRRASMGCGASWHDSRMSSPQPGSRSAPGPSVTPRCGGPTRVAISSARRTTSPSPWNFCGSPPSGWKR